MQDHASETARTPSIRFMGALGTMEPSPGPSPSPCPSPSPSPDPSPNPDPNPDQVSGSNRSRRSVRTGHAPAPWPPTWGVQSLRWGCGATAGGGCTERRCDSPEHTLPAYHVSWLSPQVFCKEHVALLSPLPGDGAVPNPKPEPIPKPEPKSNPNLAPTLIP